MPGDIDRLDLSDLHGPLLDDFMKSRQLYIELRAVAEEIRKGYIARVPRDTHALANSAKVTMHKSTTFRDRRWEADLTIGNAKVDYAAAVEEESQPLGETIRAMGYRW
ncbi:hypothetical protein SEA_LITTLELAF_43 [Mycobacterium phage LittleLaf]|uniref:Uncharacterized protein n=13 Tax=Marvinvirus TaxID=1982091 RepID=A0A3G8FER3_9CAUD|nr:hypothetical protein FH33_gp041 [Mycobacterium phage MosMoris]YP_009614159.1 hypothetical protein FDI61_gp041 [Mycobacterium phage Marvin]ANM46265.1 hypothetical protein SEA_GATTACA_42 [Mycobacterium phage Gattaca]AVE00788.1 hypothetical protein SEA_TESLA_42 [Mycobacterium phage Tesla]AYB69849.1 hypothetical protein SEA_LITTLELAF_43 [Mycobacterium phage LittleLaf]AYB70678.1 hypothetical protein SEA_VASUNZINGA_43 [Mycobacterium phage VasuNzinga]AZF93311.1 hypothetical protein SEA_BEELZEBUB_